MANGRTFDAAASESQWPPRCARFHSRSNTLLDVDFFKRFNDRYGHVPGDACLRAVAQAVSAQCHRVTDLVARYGGEEFAIVLPETEPAGIRTLLPAVLSAVDELQIEHADSACAPYVTVSVGAVSLRPTLDMESSYAFQLADQMLLQSKRERAPSIHAHRRHRVGAAN